MDQLCFYGIRAGVAVLLINAFLKLYKTLKVDVFNIGMILLALAAVLFFDVSAFW
jgi:chromate transport protein ChrA